MGKVRGSSGEVRMIRTREPTLEFEWDCLTEILGLALLSRLLGISSSMVRRYKARTNA